CGRRRKEMASPWEGLLWAYNSWWLAARLQTSEPFDAVHAHFIMPGGIVAAHLKAEFAVPFLITVHGSDVPGYNRERLKLAHVLARPWWRRICRRADLFVFPSQSLLNLFRRTAPNFRTDVIPNGCDIGRFTPLAKERRILLCSRLVERKGFHYFLEAIRDLDLPGWAVDIVGDGPMRPRLEELERARRTPVPL